MKNKTHHYLLAENPINNVNGEIFIYSTRYQKRALISVNRIEIEDIMQRPGGDDGYTLYFESKSTGLPEFHELTVFDNIDTPDHKVPVILKDAGKWYKNYLIWEEKQKFDGLDTEPLLKDYNDGIRGLKIIRGSDGSKFMSIFRGKIEVFDSVEELFAWIVGNYKIEEDLLDKGFINKI